MKLKHKLGSKITIISRMDKIIN